ncbi:hypothetical protein A4X13_0g8800 [Tilletia indica]|uniref:Uncharacterized protein n=1 Tax=Tilletia indica TaxID=43049 RepID=A0A8T8SD15_9BASI|nr:hypothetical protein A4X13_0g8800 [Tilletia indica]
MPAGKATTTSAAWSGAASQYESAPSLPGSYTSPKSRHRALPLPGHAHGDQHHRSSDRHHHRWLDSSPPWTWILSTIVSSLPLLLSAMPPLFITYTRTLHHHAIIILFSSLNPATETDEENNELRYVQGPVTLPMQSLGLPRESQAPRTAD